MKPLLTFEEAKQIMKCPFCFADDELDIVGCGIFYVDILVDNKNVPYAPSIEEGTLDSCDVCPDPAYGDAIGIDPKIAHIWYVLCSACGEEIDSLQTRKDSRGSNI